MAVRIFVSHASADRDIVERLVAMLKAAFDVPREAIRCSTLAEHGLAPGADIAEDLRRDLANADLVLGVITSRSRSSAWVTAELGAAWALHRWVVLLLGPSVRPEEVLGPVQSHKQVRMDDGADLTALLGEIAGRLGYSAPGRERLGPAADLLAGFYSAKRRVSRMVLPAMLALAGPFAWRAVGAESPAWAAILSDLLLGFAAAWPPVAAAAAAIVWNRVRARIGLPGPGSVAFGAVFFILMICAWRGFGCELRALWR